MLPGRWLHRLAQRCCAEAAREQIVEPLLSDLQHQWFTSTRTIDRVRKLIRGYTAFWESLAVCGARAAARAIIIAPARVTFETAFVGFYAIAIVLVILFGPGWVRTGEVTDTAQGVAMIRGLIGLFGPGFLLHRYWPRATGWCQRTRVVIAFTVLTALGCWMYPGNPTQLALLNLLYLSIFTLRRGWRTAKA